MRNILDCVSLDGLVRANFILEFSTLEEDWKFLSSELKFDANLEKINCSCEKKDYRTYYDDNLIQIVAKLYKKDIDYFGYDFEKPKFSNFDRVCKN